jgi:hypothetical protein
MAALFDYIGSCFFSINNNKVINLQRKIPTSLPGRTNRKLFASHIKILCFFSWNKFEPCNSQKFQDADTQTYCAIHLNMVNQNSKDMIIGLK